MKDSLASRRLGTPIKVADYSAGYCFGERALLGSSKDDGSSAAASRNDLGVRSATVVARGSVICLVLEKEDLVQCLGAEAIASLRRKVQAEARWNRLKKFSAAKMRRAMSGGNDSTSVSTSGHDWVERPSFIDNAETLTKTVEAKGEATPPPPETWPRGALPCAASIAFADLEFVPGGVLGVGRNACVKLVRWKESGGTFALKCFPMSTLARSGSTTANRVLSERDALAKMTCGFRRDGAASSSSPFVVKLYASFVERDVGCYLLLEHCPCADLLTLLYTTRTHRLRESVVRFLAVGICAGLRHIHASGIMHRDIKPENILLDSAGYPKICDLDNCFVQSPGNPDLRSWTSCGTPLFMAPELVLNRGHGKEVDHWSCGVLLYELLTGRTPFEDEKNGGVARLVRGKLPGRGSNSAAAAAAETKSTPKDRAKRRGSLLVSPLSELRRGSGWGGSMPVEARICQGAYEEKIQGCSETGEMFIKDLLHPEPTERLSEGAGGIRGHVWFQAVNTRDTKFDLERIEGRAATSPIRPYVRTSEDMSNFFVWPDDAEPEGGKGMGDTAQRSEEMQQAMAALMEVF